MHLKKKLLLPVIATIAFAVVVCAQTPKHSLRLDDLTRFRNVSDPQISPDGQWIA